MQWPNQDGNECHKPIEDVEVGDYVWAYNEDTGESDWKPVERLFRNETKEWYHIHVAGEEIICTPNHPFYVIGRGFVEAKDLKVFEILLKSNGVQVSIDSIEIEELEKAETTYNFEVADFHTYYVSKNNILVHNDCKNIEKEVPENYEPTYANGVYDTNYKHGMVKRGNVSARIPSNAYGQYALDNAIYSPHGGKALYAYNGEEIFQFMPDEFSNKWHGFIVDNLKDINSSSARNWLEHYFRIK